METTRGIRILAAVEEQEKWQHIKDLLRQDPLVELWEKPVQVTDFLQISGACLRNRKNFLPGYNTGIEAVLLDGSFFEMLCKEIREQEKEAAAEEVELWRQLAQCDEMTGLYNRKYCMEMIGEFLEKQQRFTLCFVDADKLKAVNDLFGHVNGDRFILQVARTLRRGMEGRGIVCRIYGDEFVILLPETDQAEAGRLMERIQQKLLEEEKLFPFRMTVSYGFCEYNGERNMEAQELLNQAERQMYEQKGTKKEEDVRRKK